MKNWTQHSANRKPDFWHEEAQKEIKEELQVMAQQLSMKIGSHQTNIQIGT